MNLFLNTLTKKAKGLTVKDKGPYYYQKYENIIAEYAGCCALTKMLEGERVYLPTDVACSRSNKKKLGVEKDVKEIQKKLGIDGLLFYKNEKGELRTDYNYGIDFKLQDGADKWGTVNIEVEFDRGHGWEPCGIFSPTNTNHYFGYIIKEKMYVMSKEWLKEQLNHESSINSENHDERNEFHKRKRTVRVCIELFNDEHVKCLALPRWYFKKRKLAASKLRDEQVENPSSELYWIHKACETMSDY